MGSPSAPEQPVPVLNEEGRSQPKPDRDAGQGMAVCVGPIRPDSVLDIKFILLSHNTIRGATGAATLIAELLKYQRHL